jgi:hypothetical protein
MGDFNAEPVAAVIGSIPYRLALAGGWIDQPFISALNPTPPGSMVVVAVEPRFWFMERAGIATGTRKIASKLWHNRLPPGSPEELVQALYEQENAGKAEPSGSQDMIGLIYPGINRLDYRFDCHGGVFPCHIESTQAPEIVSWLEKVIHILPVAPRPEGYNPLGEKHLDPAWIQRLGQSGKSCFDAILHRNLAALGASFNECMACWESLLPHVVRHSTITTDLVGLMKAYQSRYPGAMYSGCGGGYLFVASEEPVPGAFQVQIRVTPSQKP